MPGEAEELIAFLKKITEVQESRIKEQAVTIDNLRIMIADLQVTVANLNETLDEFRRKFFGVSSEKVSVSAAKEMPDTKEAGEEPKITTVTEHTRKTNQNHHEKISMLPYRFDM